MRFEILRVSDHPVCGASVASRLFICAAATPPHEEGNAHRLNNAGIFPSLPRRGGRAIKKWSRSEKARTGWSLASDVSECVLKHLRVSDHPVCGASVASRLFSDAAATPPHEEGNAHRLNNNTTATNNLLVSIFLLHATFR